MARIGYFDYDNASPEAKSAHDVEARKNGALSNMKRTLLHSASVFTAYQEWYHLRDVVVSFLGTRAFIVFAHAISTRNACLLCSTYFRKALFDIGLSPETFVPTEDEALLIEFAEEIVERRGAVPDTTWTRLKSRYSERELIELVGFAGLMVATNLFNSVIEVDLDEVLLPHRQG
jgi:hypothetical protein